MKPILIVGGGIAGLQAANIMRHRVTDHFPRLNYNNVLEDMQAKIVREEKNWNFPFN